MRFFFFARYPRECEELRGPVTKITGKNTGNAWAFAFLVGGIPTPLKNMKVNWDEDIPNIWKNKQMLQTTNQLLVVKMTDAY